MKPPPDTTRDDFENWLAHMDDALDEFIASLPDDVGSRLDYSVASLAVLERWILDRWASPKAALSDDCAAPLGGAARYLGETIRKLLGGYWDIDLTKRNNVYFGLPVLVDIPPYRKTPDCPLTLVTASTDRRTGDYLSTLVGNWVLRAGQARR